MEAAIERIARELVDGYPSLAENLYMASLEIRAGKAFSEALERMGERLGIEEATHARDAPPAIGRARHEPLAIAQGLLATRCATSACRGRKRKPTLFPPSLWFP